MANINDINSNDLEKILDLNQYEANILEYYDNVTYNIRFYMLNHPFQKRFAKQRQDGTVGDFVIPDDQKIIIAETGVSETYDIQSLQISAVHTSVSNRTPVATYQIDMRLKEVGGCDLVNKITAVSKAIGYDSYVTQPYHIDVWFSGYRQDNGMPEKVIEGMVLTYEVIVAEVKTNTDNTGTVYNFIMTPVSQSSMTKYVNTMFRIGEVRPEDGKSSTYGGYVKRIVDLINEKYFEENPTIKDKFIDESGKPTFLKIRNYITGNATTYEQIYINAVEKYKKEQEEERNNLLKNFYQTYQNKNKNMTSISDAIEQSFTPINNSSVTESSVSYENEEISDFISPQSSDSQIEGFMQFDTGTSFENVLQELCFHSNNLKSYVVRPRYSVEYIEPYGGIECKRIYVDLIFTKNNYLEYFQTRGKELDTSPEAELERIKKMQISEARNLIVNNNLKKRYEWMYNGRDTSVLEFTSSLDKLWYANVGVGNILTVEAAASDNPKKASFVNDEKTLLSFYDKMILQPKDLLEALKQSNRPFDGVRPLASDKRLYLDDIYHCMDDDTIIKYLNERKIYEKNDSLADSDENKENASTNQLSIIAKAGYGNIHAAGNLVELELTILGDPFWLGLYSDNEMYKHINTASQFDVFHHFAFVVNSSVGQTPDGQADIENTTEFSNIYQIVESVSVFEEGKFTQKLKGCLDPAFMHLARIEGLSNAKTR